MMASVWLAMDSEVAMYVGGTDPRVDAITISDVESWAALSEQLQKPNSFGEILQRSKRVPRD